jgi:hypothetical protein
MEKSGAKFKILKCLKQTQQSTLNSASYLSTATSYVAASAGALGTALGLNSLVKSLPPVVGRLVPFVAVSAANSVNIPMMRRLELTEGIQLMTEDGEHVAKSPKAAAQGISKVIMSRVAMAAPGMLTIPFFMNHLEKKGTLKKYPRLAAPLQVIICGRKITLK